MILRDTGRPREMVWDGCYACCLDGWVAASIEELEGRSMLAYVGLLELGSLLLFEATVVLP